MKQLKLRKKFSIRLLFNISRSAESSLHRRLEHLLYLNLSTSSSTIIDSTHSGNASSKGCASRETILPKKVWSYSSPVSSPPTPPSPSPATTVASQTWLSLYLLLKNLWIKFSVYYRPFSEIVMIELFRSEVKQGLSCITCSWNN